MIAPPSRGLVAAVVALCLAGVAGLVGSRAAHERARLAAPLSCGGEVEATLPLLAPLTAARGITGDRLRVLGGDTPITDRIPGAVRAVPDSAPADGPPWALLCADAPSCAAATDDAARLVARGHAVAGLLTLPAELLDALDRPAPRSFGAVALTRLQGRLLGPVAWGAPRVGWVLALGLAPLALHLLFLPMTLGPPPGRPRERRDVLLDTLARLGRLGVLALLASAALDALAEPSSPVGAAAAAVAVAAAGAASARTRVGRGAAVAVAIVALPWLLEWPAPVHALVVGAALTEAAVTRVRGG